MQIFDDQGGTVVKAFLDFRLEKNEFLFPHRMKNLIQPITLRCFSVHFLNLFSYKALSIKLRRKKQKSYSINVLQVKRKGFSNRFFY